MPFTTSSGFVYMLRHLAPDIVYVTESLSGVDGGNVKDIERWVGHTIVVVGGDGGNLGGLVDTDTEGEDMAKKSAEPHHSKWWQSSDLVGLGKSVEVVDSGRFEDDWIRRFGGQE
jgi:hypothetical protein